jgi:Protein of unknown function (DUF2569)
LTTLRHPLEDVFQSFQTFIMPIPCPRCGSETEPGATVCIHCGSELLLQNEDAVVPAPTDIPVAEPEYAPPASEAPALFTSTFESSDSAYEGLGGWLIFTIIGLIFAPLRLMYTLFTVHLRLLTNPRMQPYLLMHGSIHALILFEVITNVIFLLILIWLNYLFFNKKRAFPAFMICYLVFVCIVMIADHFASVALLAKAPLSFTLVRTLVTSSIWIPYYIRSRRVKATFVH